MGLLSRLTGMASAKKPTDDVLLAHAMLLMAGADGDIDDSEIAVVRGFASTLPEFKDRDFGQVVGEAQKLVRRFGNLKESVNALSELSTPALRAKAYVLAAGRRRRGRGRAAHHDAAPARHRRPDRADDHLGAAAQVREVEAPR